MATTEYTRVVSSLYALEAAKGMDFKLERVALALRNLGDPQARFVAVHIAGTNGKGSVAAMLHAILDAAGHRVGLYTSPHLVSFTERIRVGAASIAEDEVVALAREIHSAATVRGIELTFFEFVTVMAFLHFARRAVDVAVVEVGLGGRLDATNVLDAAVAVITTIGLDHQEFLGDTIESIAREKAGIMKAGRPVIIGNVCDPARRVLAATAAAVGAPVRWLGRDFSWSADGALRYRGFGGALENLVLPLRGHHQRDNAATAIAAAMQLREQFRIQDAAIQRGIAQVQWPARLEVVQARPLVVLDGAHNADGVAALVQELPAIVGGRAVHMLFGVMRDKSWQPMVETLAPHVARVTVVAALPPRGEDPEVLAKAFARYCPVSVAASPLQGLLDLLQNIGDNHAILVTGSLFLVGAVLPHFLSRHGRASLFSTSSTPLHP
ncbi:MAG TPA: folylpolyglutamate synthase/dihydrofolate synthase family protein [Candidatus Margulisiibacteriota bacterium]|nr:folylpolyglutamate synthase/dihydrofolate synthase family protein [Candidatus Margulisiibacteriota bacterium]